MRKPLAECVHIFLDTTVLINLLKPDTTQDEGVIFTKKLLTFLTENPAGVPLSPSKHKHEERKFYYSTISLSEIALIQSNEELNQKIGNSLVGDNLEVVNYTKNIALHHNVIFKDLVNKKVMNEIARTRDLVQHDLKLARDLLSRDFMILASASYLKTDLILTSERGGFKDLADRLGIPCAETYEDRFQVSESGKNIFDFA
jgi:predicted nucleic acid-binding protein